jgi:hypothetical protein
MNAPAMRANATPPVFSTPTNSTIDEKGKEELFSPLAERIPGHKLADGESTRGSIEEEQESFSISSIGSAYFSNSHNHRVDLTTSLPHGSPMSLSLNNERWEILLSWKNRMWVCGEAAL